MAEMLDEACLSRLAGCYTLRVIVIVIAGIVVDVEPAHSTELGLLGEKCRCLDS